MYELQEIMRQRESKIFAEILNRLREGKHTELDTSKIKERCVDDKSCPKEAPRLFIKIASLINMTLMFMTLQQETSSLSWQKTVSLVQILPSLETKY